MRNSGFSQFKSAGSVVSAAVAASIMASATMRPDVESILKVDSISTPKPRPTESELTTIDLPVEFSVLK